MILGFKEYIDELLLEAKSPEEVVRILSYKYPAAPESLIKNLVETDPTKKKSYSSWVLQVEKDLVKISNYLKSGRLAKIFDYFRENAKNGASLTDKKSLEDAEHYLPDSSNVLASTDNAEANDFEVEFETPDWIVATPNTYAASKKLGENTKWCTADAYGNGEYYYDDYTKAGRLWVNFDKRRKEVLNGVTYPYKRYQFCFERNAFLDAHDDPFNFDDLDMPQEVLDFYAEKGYDTDSLTDTEEARYERYSEERYMDAVYLFGSLELMREWDDDMRWDDDAEDADYKVYNTDYDTVDSHVNSEYYRKDSIVFKSEKYELAILEEKYNKNCFSIVINMGGTYEIYPTVNSYKLLVEDGSDYVAFIDYNGNFVYASCDGEFRVNREDSHKSFSDFAEIFLNRALSRNGDLYIEVSDEGTHTLLRVDYNEHNLDMIIPNDIPKNGRYFELGEDGRIQGKYRSYSLSTTDDGDDDFKPETALANKNLLLCRNKQGAFNVFSTDNTSEKLFEENFDSLLHDLTNSNYNGLLVEYNGKGRCLLSIAERKRVSDFYPRIQASRNNDIVVAANLTPDGKELENARYIVTGKGDVRVKTAYPYSVNGRTPVYVENEDGTSRFSVFNMNTMEFDVNWIKRAETLGYDNLGSDKGRVILAEANDGTICLYNWVDNKIITTGLTNKRKPRPFTDTQGKSLYPLYDIFYNDGTRNIFNRDTEKVLLKVRPDEIQCGTALSDGNLYAMLRFNDRKEIYFILISGNGQAEYALNGMPIRLGGHDINPIINRNIATLTVDNDRQKVFKIDLGNGQVAFYGIHPDTRTYDEIPIDSAPDETKRVAAEIFPWMASKVSAINEWLRKSRKR